MAPVFFWFFLALASYLILMVFVLFPVLAGEGIPADLCVLLVVLVVALSTLVVNVTLLVVLALMVHVIY